jgi:cardiolipin synthase
MCPFYEKLRGIQRRGVAVTIIAPRANNRKLFDPYVRWESIRSGLDLRLYEPGMTHLKAMLIDEDFLILGSSNFDYLSCHSQQEIMAVCTDPRVISSFEERVMREDLRNSSTFEGSIGTIRGSASTLILESMGKLSVLMSRLS